MLARLSQRALATGRLQALAAISDSCSLVVANAVAAAPASTYAIQAAGGSLACSVRGLASTSSSRLVTQPQWPASQRRQYAADAGDSDSKVLAVGSDAQFRELLEQNKGGKALIVDFHAIWCGPCRQISPYFEELSAQYPGLQFLSVDVDKLTGVAAEASISAVPAFQVWRDGKIVGEFVGASKHDLKALCDKHQ